MKTTHPQVSVCTRALAVRILVATSIAFLLGMFTADAAFSPYFYDARITGRIDMDGDGYARQFNIEFDVDSNEAGNYYVKIYEYDGALPDDYLTTSATFAVTGTATDYRSVTILCSSYPGSDLLSHGTAEFELELYNAANNQLIQTWRPSNDPDLGNVLVELSSEDQATFTPSFYDARITSRVDQDGDGYARQLAIEFDVDSNIAGNYYVKIYEYDGTLNDDYLTTSSTFAVNGTATDYRSVTIVCDNWPGADLLSHGTAEFELELYNAANNQLVQTWRPSNDSDLGGVLVELSSEDEPAEISVFGNGVSISDGDTTPSSSDGTDFGSVVQGQSGPTRTFTVRNDGDATLTLGSVSVPSGFTVTEGLSSSLSAGSSDTFTVRLDSTSTGTKSGQISFSNNDSNENPYNFSITGSVTAFPAEITVLGNGISIADGDTTPSSSDGTDFGSVIQGQAGPTRTFTVRNDGGSTLTLGSVVVPSGFTVTEALSSSLAPGVSDSFTVRLDSTATGTKSGQVSFSNNDSNEDPFNFSITGIVTAPNNPPSAPSGGISGQPSLLKVGEVYSITTQYTDPNGAGDLRYCYLRIGHPAQTITLRYDAVTTAAGPLTVPEMALISPVSVERTSIANGFQLKWRFFLKRAWPLTGSGINFQVRAEDFAGAANGYNSDGRSLAFQNPAYGCTIIIHGYQTPFSTVPTWVQTMGSRIAQRLGNGEVWEYQPATGGWLNVDSVGSDSDYEQVLLLNWADESDNVSTGYAEGAADAFVAALIQSQKATPGNFFLDRIHIIGHSRGAVVASEMIERLRSLSISGEDARIFGGNVLDSQIDVTFLDPHTSGHPLLGDFGDPDVNEPDLPGRGVVVWRNVKNANNYYQTVDDPPSDLIYLNGEFILASRNRNLDSPLVGIDHSEVHAWYFGTIDPEATEDELAAMIQEAKMNIEGTKAKLSSAKVQQALKEERDVIVQNIVIQRPTWYLDNLGIIEGFAHTRRGGEFPHDNAREPLDSTAKSEAFHDLISEGVFNGAFVHGSSQIVDMPAWDRHGGGGAAPLISDALRLIGEFPSSGREWRRHNRLFIPTAADTLTFRWRVSSADSGTPPNVDRLLARIGTQIVAGGSGNEIWLNQTSPAFLNGFASIPVALRSTVQTVTFEIIGGGAVLNSVVEIDDVGFTSDVVAPTVTINQAAGQADPTSSSPINFSVVFSEPVTGFTSSDVTLGGTAGATSKTLTGGGTTYNVAVSGMTQSGTVTATVPAGGAQDAAGNGNTSSTSTDNTVTYIAPDTTPPTVTINQAAGQTDPTSSSPINFSVVFSEPVTGFTSSDVTLGGTAGATSKTVTGSGTTYNVAVSGMTQSGTVIATIPAGGAQDAGGNGNTASTSSDNTVTYNAPDTTPPTVTINQAAGQADPTTSSPINFTVVFSEPVAGFTSSDVTLGGMAGATSKTVTGSGTTYNVAISGMTQSGTVTAAIPAGGAQDTAGNGNAASTSSDNTVTFNVPTSPSLSASRHGSNLVLSWPTNDPGFKLFYATNLPATTWVSNIVVPAVVNGQYTITNNMTNPVRLYRLKK